MSSMQHSCLCRYWFSFFTAYAAVTCNVFQWTGQLPKTAPSRGWSGPHKIHGSLGPPDSPPNGISRADQFIHFFTAHEYDQQTHRERPRIRLVTTMRYTNWRILLYFTLLYHATPSVAIDHIYTMQAMRPKNKERNLAVANWVLAHTTMLSDQNQNLHRGNFRDSSLVSKCHQNRLSVSKMLWLKSALSHFFVHWIRA